MVDVLRILGDNSHVGNGPEGAVSDIVGRCLRRSRVKYQVPGLHLFPLLKGPAHQVIPGRQPVGPSGRRIHPEGFRKLRLPPGRRRAEGIFCIPCHIRAFLIGHSLENQMYIRGAVDIAAVLKISVQDRCTAQVGLPRVGINQSVRILKIALRRHKHFTDCGISVHSSSSSLSARYVNYILSLLFLQPNHPRCFGFDSNFPPALYCLYIRWEMTPLFCNETDSRRSVRWIFWNLQKTDIRNVFSTAVRSKTKSCLKYWKPGASAPPPATTSPSDFMC